MLERILNWLFYRAPRRRPHHFIRPRNSHWLPPWVAWLVLMFVLTCNGATVNWSLNNVIESGSPVNMGLALLVLGNDSTATEAALRAGTFSMAGASTITGGKATGKLTAAAVKTTYMYLVITYGDQYSISAVQTTKIPSTITFSGATWETVPEPSGLLFAGFVVLLLRRPRRL